MTTASIRSLKPNVSQSEALRKFSSMGLGTLYRRLRIGPLRRVADVYVPFYWISSNSPLCPILRSSPTLKHAIICAPR